LRPTRIIVALLIVLVAALLRAVTAEAVAANVRATNGTEDDRGELDLHALDADTGAALPVRIRLIPRSPLRDEQVMIARHGSARSALAPGGYRVLVTHGPEWSISEHDVEVRAGRITEVRAALTKLVEGRQYSACELHMHTTESPDSEITLAERIASLMAEDVHFAVVTDHNVVTDAGAALEAAGIGSLPGLEVTTWAPEFGHFNVFPRTQAPRYSRTNPNELLREVRSAPDSFIQINHPRLEAHIGYFSLGGYIRELGRMAPEYPLAFDAVEVWNGYDLGSVARRDEIFQDWLALTARGQRISATGGSDAHAIDRPPYVGYPRTYVHVPRERARNAREILMALKQGRSFVTNGPLLDVRVHGKGPGDLVVLSGDNRTISLDVQLDAPTWMGSFEVEVWLGEQRVASELLSDTTPGELSQQATVRLQLDVGDARSLVVAAHGSASLRALLGRDARPFAFTNPIWIEGG
jgi:predicted metal-dependent phosphoesterase TrpH